MRRIIATIAMLIAVTSNAQAASNAADIARVEAYLSTITTIEANFSQVAPNGDLSDGVFYLKRPGKMRWQYAPPTPILLVSDGDTVTYFDAELDQVSYVSLDDTLAGFLAKQDMKLNSKATKLLNFSAKNGVIRATLQQRNQPEQGSLTLEFADNPLALKQMIVADAAGNKTHIALQGAKYGQKLANSLFTFEDPRGVIRRKRK